MNLRKFLYWMFVVARAVTEVFGRFFEPPEREEEEVGDDDDDMKPERIQIFRLILEVVVLVLDEVAKEQGKDRGSGSDAAEKVAE